MLPKELSEDLCSLKPKVDRLAFTVEMVGRQTGVELPAEDPLHSGSEDEQPVELILLDED